MKRVIAIILAVLTILCFAGCRKYTPEVIRDGVEQLEIIYTQAQPNDKTIVFDFVHGTKTVTYKDENGEPRKENAFVSRERMREIENFFYDAVINDTDNVRKKKLHIGEQGVTGAQPYFSMWVTWEDGKAPNNPTSEWEVFENNQDERAVWVYVGNDGGFDSDVPTFFGELIDISDGVIAPEWYD